MFDKSLLSIERIKTKDLILEKLKTCDKFGVVRPVGFGKSHIIMELCNKLPGKKLIIEPRDNIVEYIKEFGNYNNTDFIIYSNLLKQNFNHESLLDYDYIFLDEMHRSVTEKWGNILKKDLEDYKGKMIGFSATPERMDGKNPIELIFNNEEIEPLYLAESIEQGILPQIKYVSSIYEIDYRYYKNKALQKKLSNYDINTEVKNIFEEFIDYSKPLHIIVFVSRINDIEQAKNFIELWIDKDINHFVMHSKKSKKFNNQELEDFYNSKEGINILYSINMFTEGIHLSNIDVAVFLRKTQSNIIYQQQLGRMISEHKEDAIVFDLVNNAYNLDNGYISIWENFAKKRNISISNIKVGKKKEELKIYTRQEDLINIIKENTYTFTYLSEEEKKFIEENAMTMITREIAKKLNKKPRTIRNYYKRNNIKYKKEVYYLSEEEKDFIEKNAKNMTIRKIVLKLGRSESTIRDYCDRNNIEFKKEYYFLSEEEKDFIKKNAMIMTPKEISKKLNRGIATIRYYYKKNNIKYKKKYNIFTEEEKDFIKKNAKNMTIKEIFKKLNKSGTTIRDKNTILYYCIRNNIEYKKEFNPLSKKEKDFIKKNIENMMPKEIAKKLNRSDCTIREYCNRNNIEFKNIRKKTYPLLSEEKDFIKKNAKNMILKEIAEKLNRAEPTIRNYCRLNYIEYKKKINYLTKEEKEFIKNNINNISHKKIAEKLNRDKNTIISYCKRNNIKKG